MFDLIPTAIMAGGLAAGLLAYAACRAGGDADDRTDGRLGDLGAGRTPRTAEPCVELVYEVDLDSPPAGRLTVPAAEWAAMSDAERDATARSVALLRVGVRWRYRPTGRREGAAK